MTFLTGQKAWGGTQDKNFCNETKILLVILDRITDGITGDRPEMANFELYRQFEKMVKYDRIFKLFMDLIQL